MSLKDSLNDLAYTIDNFVNNSSSRNVTAFTGIKPKFLDISDKHSLESIDPTTAYAARQTASHNARNTWSGRPASSLSNASTTECTFCRKNNLTFIGHVYTNCDKSWRHKELQNRQNLVSANSPKDKGRSGKRQKANDASNESDNGATEPLVGGKLKRETASQRCESS